MRAMRVQWLDTTPLGSSAAEPHHSFNLSLPPLQEWSIQVCQEHGTDTQHPQLLPASPSGFVIASAARSACAVSWDKVMSLAGFMFYCLGICVPDSSALPAAGAQSRETAGPAQGVSKLHAIQKTCSLFRFVLAEEDRQLYLSSFTWTDIVSVVCKLIICLHKNCSVNEHEPCDNF